MQIQAYSCGHSRDIRRFATINKLENEDKILHHLSRLDSSSEDELTLSKHTRKRPLCDKLPMGCRKKMGSESNSVVDNRHNLIDWQSTTRIRENPYKTEGESNPLAIGQNKCSCKIGTSAIMEKSSHCQQDNSIEKYKQIGKTFKEALELLQNDILLKTRDKRDASKASFQNPQSNSFKQTRLTNYFKEGKCYLKCRRNGSHSRIKRNRSFTSKSSSLQSVEFMKANELEIKDQCYTSNKDFKRKTDNFCSETKGSKIENQLSNIIKKLETEKNNTLEHSGSDSTMGMKYEETCLQQSNSNKNSYDQIQNSFQELFESLGGYNEAKEKQINISEEKPSPQSPNSFKQTSIYSYFKQVRQNDNTNINNTFSRSEVKTQNISFSSTHNIDLGGPDSFNFIVQPQEKYITHGHQQQKEIMTRKEHHTSDRNGNITNITRNQESTETQNNIVDIINRLKAKSNTLNDKCTETCNETNSEENNEGNNYLSRKKSYHDLNDLMSCKETEALRNFVNLSDARYSKISKACKRTPKICEIKTSKFTNSREKNLRDLIKSLEAKNTNSASLPPYNSDEWINEKVVDVKGAKVDRKTQFGQRTLSDMSVQLQAKKKNMTQNTEEGQSSQKNYKEIKNLPVYTNGGENNISGCFKETEVDNNNCAGILKINSIGSEKFKEVSHIFPHGKKYEELKSQKEISENDINFAKSKELVCKFSLSPNTEQRYKEMFNMMHSEVIKSEEDTSDTKLEPSNDIENSLEVPNGALRISDLSENGSIQFGKKFNENILLDCNNLENITKFNSITPASNNPGKGNKDLRNVKILEVDSTEPSSSVLKNNIKNNNMIKKCNTVNKRHTYDEKCVEIIKEKIENATCLNVLLQEILSEDFSVIQQDKVDNESQNEYTETETVKNLKMLSDMKTNQSTEQKLENLNNILHEDNMLKLIMEDVKRYYSQPEDTINEGIYGIKDFVRNLPKLSETRKPCIKRYRKGTMKIYRISKLKKQPDASNEESANFESVIEKLSQSYYGTTKQIESPCSGRSVSTNSSYVTDETRSEVLSRGSTDLTTPEQLIRRGINKLSNNKSLLYKKNQSTEVVFNKQLIRKIIQGILINVVQDFANMKSPSFTFRSHSIGNCIFKDGILQLKPLSEAQFTKVSYTKSSSRTKFNLILFILHKVKSLLDTNTKLTKREIYYQLKTIVRDQGYIDRAIHAVTAILQVGLHSLNIIAQKGLVFGDLKILLSSGQSINCNVPGTLIPQDVNDIVEMHSRAYFILVVEKESIFHKLLEENLPNTLTRPFILITGKGFPDLNTQLFVRKLWVVMSIPVLIFVDADPDGINIMLNYRFGSVSSAHISHCLAVPNAKWLGVFPSDIEQFDVVKQALSHREVSKIKQMLKLPYMNEFPEIDRQLRILLDRNCKAGIEGLFKTDTFLSNVYLPNKFYSNDYI